MAEEQYGEQVSQAWDQHRPYLVDLAFRMLDDIGAAEDVVQDAFSRLMAAPRGEIQDDRGWLIVVTSRLCLDQIRSARSRRERPHDASEIEFVAGRLPAAGHDALGDPADRVTLDDSVRLALLVVLQRLSPAERVVFVLHDIFSVPFEFIAQTVGRTAPTCRQLARRARQKIEDSQGGVTFDVAASEHRQVTEKFIAACAHGDLDGLVEVLAPDAWGDFDAGPGQPGPRGVLHGAVRVARHLLYFWGPGSTLVTQPVAGQPALLGFVDRRLAGVLVFTVRGGRIQAVHVIADPRQLSFVGSQLG
ncbi:MAG TPA: RNA polymerase sigma factor SigI [Streptosporangiaceae bacterium]|jgi:RNA polymerase sigma-70 factor (ECF subfamily)